MVRHAKAAAECVLGKPVDGERYQLAAFEAEQGAGVTWHQGAQRVEKAPIALGLGYLPGEVVYQRQQGIEGGQRESHCDLMGVVSTQQRQGSF
jgi:hypothetical protein